MQSTGNVVRKGTTTTNAKVLRCKECGEMISSKRACEILKEQLHFICMEVLNLLRVQRGYREKAVDMNEGHVTERRENVAFQKAGKKQAAQKDEQENEEEMCKRKQGEQVRSLHER